MALRCSIYKFAIICVYVVLLSPVGSVTDRSIVEPSANKYTFTTTDALGQTRTKQFLNRKRPIKNSINARVNPTGLDFIGQNIGQVLGGQSLGKYLAPLNPVKITPSNVNILQSWDKLMFQGTATTRSLPPALGCRPVPLLPSA